MFGRERSLLLLLIAATASAAAPATAAPVVVPGRGPARTDCLTSWSLDLASAPTAAAVRKARLVCNDGDPACDVDGVADRQCTFRLRVCFGSLPSQACTPKPVGIYDLKRPSRRAARRKAVSAASRAAILGAVGALDQPIFPGTCSGDVAIRVPLRRKARSGKLVLRGRAHGADGRGTDTDVLRLVCKTARGAALGAVQQAFILTSDFTNIGGYSTVTLDPPRTVRRDLGATHSDAVGRAFGDRVYVVNRLGQDNIQVLDPTTGQSLSACSVGNGSNPQDIVVVDQDKAYVTRLRDGLVSIVDPTSPRTCEGFRRGRIDLTRFADADGSPELGRMLRVGDRVYVALLRLDRNRLFLPATRGLVAVIDTTTDALVDTDPSTPAIDAIQLAAENPFGMAFDAPTGRIWVWETGSFFETGDGGIEAIDPATNRTVGFVATEDSLGGTVTVAAPYTADRAFAVLADGDFTNSLVAFSPRTGEVLDTLRVASSFFPDVEVSSRGEVWLADRTLRAPGIRIYDAETGAPVAGPIDVGLPPFDIVFVP